LGRPHVEELNSPERRTTNDERLLRINAVCFLILFLLALPLKGYGLSPSPAPSPVDISSPLSLGVQVYQKLLSPVLASECYMLPSCSTYAKQALSEYGPFLGLLLTIDRLLHEANEDQTSPLVREGNKIKLYDPPSANVWWKKNKIQDP